MSPRNVDVDRLSLFPDELLTHILSLMPTKSAVGTSILSKRWRYSWMTVHSFDFHYIDRIPDSDNADSDKYISFVDRVLKLFKTSQVKLFRLHFSEFLVGNPHVLKWINEVRLNVQELDIQVFMRELPLSLFNCKTLTKLTLAVGGYGLDILDILNVPSGVIFPCLKTFDINVFNEPFSNVCKLISACPVLENLRISLESSRYRDGTEDYNFNIPTLKRFELRTPRTIADFNKVVLNVPNLEFFIVGGKLSTLFVMEDFPSLVKATVMYSEVIYKHLMIELLKGLSGAKSISWSTSTIGVPYDYPMHKFPNLKHLEFKGFSCFGWFLMFEVLRHSCELEHLTIEEPESFCWKEPLSVPTCMLLHLKTMKFISFKKRECDIKFAEYLLANAKVLKKLTIVSEIWPPSDEMPLYAQLLKFPRASSCCKIDFVRKWSHFTVN